MNKQLILFMLFMGFAVKMPAQQNTDIVKIGDTMPGFTIISDDGKKFESKSLKGKVILITFFATWCPPCQKELAAIQEKLWPLYQNNPDFSLLVVGREHSGAELSEYSQKKGFTIPLYPDKSRAIYSKFADSLIPRTYLIGKDGKIKHQETGFTDEGFALLLQQIEFALKK